MSLDGFVAEPRQSAENPLGTVGMRLHQWAFPLAVWRSTHGLQGGEVNESNRVVEESFANIGATVMGRNMFNGHAGSWNAKDPWNGGAWIEDKWRSGSTLSRPAGWSGDPSGRYCSGRSCLLSTGALITARLPPDGSRRRY
jgi:hypothetical protein